MQAGFPFLVLTKQRPFHLYHETSVALSKSPVSNRIDSDNCKSNRNDSVATRNSLGSLDSTISSLIVFVTLKKLLVTVESLEIFKHSSLNLVPGQEFVHMQN